jgi:soluble lytic murein transglycosylase-like protein
MAAGTPAKRRLPAWRIIDPLPEGTLRTYYGRAEARFGVPWEVLAAVNLVETGMGRIIGLSSAGAKGPMQFMPATWRAYGLGGDVWDPEDAIMGAANYLAANGAADGTKRGMRTALRRYNNSARYVRAVLHYAALMTADPLAYRGFHAWRIYYRTHLGDVLLPTGYASRRPVPVERAIGRGGGG